MVNKQKTHVSVFEKSQTDVFLNMLHHSNCFIIYTYLKITLDITLNIPKKTYQETNKQKKENVPGNQIKIKLKSKKTGFN